MRIRGTSGLYPAVRQLGNRFAPKALILMYHRIAERDVDPWNLCVTPQHFAMHLEVIQKHAHPMSLVQLVQAHQDGRVPNRAVVITFDDGYANNLHNAKPILEHFSIPATVFVTAGYVGKNREFWWDELDRALLRPSRLPDTLELKINAVARRWDLGPAVSYSEEEYLHDCLHDHERSNRVDLYYSVWQWLRLLKEEQRENMLDEIIVWAEADSRARVTHRPLVPDEVRALAREGLVEIGAHTLHHEMLSAHPEGFQRSEIEQSKTYLQNLLGGPIASFSYPFGQYTEETVSLVQKAGFACACSTVCGKVSRHSDRFQLPRCAAENWSRETFEEYLFRWFRGRTDTIKTLASSIRKFYHQVIDNGSPRDETSAYHSHT
jgi:peptidoglycan/xylan/chitin deacetylase (PgdA/CDA1 family)